MESSTAVPRPRTGHGLGDDRRPDRTARRSVTVSSPAIRHKRDGEWHDVSYAELGEIVSEVGRGLIDLGIEPGDRVAILCTTRPEWTYADFGITTTGAVVVPIYPTNSPEECEWVAGNSESRAIVCEDATQVAKIRAGPRQPAGARDDHRHRPVRRRRRRDPARRAARARPRARPGRARRARPRGHARAAVHDHLHVGHDRPAEGLRAQPRQLPRRRLDVRDATRSCRRATSPTCSSRSPTRSRC